MDGPVTDAAGTYYGYWTRVAWFAGVWAVSVLVLLAGILWALLRRP